MQRRPIARGAGDIEHNQNNSVKADYLFLPLAHVALFHRPKKSAPYQFLLAIGSPFYRGIGRSLICIDG